MLTRAVTYFIVGLLVARTLARCPLRFPRVTPKQNQPLNYPWATMTVYAPSTGHEGLSYFLHRAAAMSLEDARKVLRVETTRSDSYCGAWNSAEASYIEKAERFPNHNWNQMPHECYIAVTCYTHERPRIARHMNACCRGAQPSALSWALFPYKSLWCFLLRAFQMLPDFQVSRVFRVPENMGETLYDRVLFTQFLPASVSFESVYNCAVRDGIHQVFSSVPAQLVRNISIYSTRENNQEVLIWPFCTFNVFAISPNFFVLEFSWEFLPRHLPGLLPAWSWIVVQYPEECLVVKEKQ